MDKELSLTLPEGYEADLSGISLLQQDSNWYSGEVTEVNSKCCPQSIAVCAIGEVRFHYYPEPKDESNYHTFYSLKDLEVYGIDTDELVAKALSKELIDWDNNNWFECYDNSIGHYLECVHGSVQEALDHAVEIIKEYEFQELVLSDELWEEANGYNR
jgi:hypothetical protein